MMKPIMHQRVKRKIMATYSLIVTGSVKLITEKREKKGNNKNINQQVLIDLKLVKIVIIQHFIIEWVNPLKKYLHAVISSYQEKKVIKRKELVQLKKEYCTNDKSYLMKLDLSYGLRI